MSPAGQCRPAGTTDELGRVWLRQSTNVATESHAARMGRWVWATEALRGPDSNTQSRVGQLFAQPHVQVLGGASSAPLWWELVA